MYPARLPASGLQCAGPSQAACTALEMQAAGVTISVHLRFLMYSTVGAAASLIGRGSQAWARREGRKTLLLTATATSWARLTDDGRQKLLI